jgi:hypothetical protein
MAWNECNSYIEGICTCGTPYKVYVNPVSFVLKMVTSDALKEKCELHTIVFSCPGCARKKTVQYNESDVKQEKVSAEDSGEKKG